MNMKIAIASDHAGYELKEKIREHLEGCDIEDFGTYNEESMDYPDTGFKAAEAVVQGGFDRAILVCGTGIGMSIVANKVAGVRASLCHSPQFAELTRKHNNSNVLCLPGRFLESEQAFKIVDVWIGTDFEGGRHQRRLDKISAYESQDN